MRLRGPIGLYAILDTGVFEPAGIATTAARMAMAGIRFFQVRAKGMPSGSAVELVRSVIAALPSDCVVVVNDRVDVALAAGAHGVHVGEDDLPPELARRVMGEDGIVGFSTHSIEDVRAVPVGVCDYIGFGPVFSSPTKPSTRVPHGIEGLAAACVEARLPVVAIGGITVRDLAAIRKAGASGAAMISGLAGADTLEIATAAVNEWRGRG